MRDQNHTSRNRPSAVIVWGSSTGYTEDIATSLHRLLRHRVDAIVDIADIEVEELTAFDFLILGVPTWHIGELQDDWDYRFRAISKLDLSGKAVALFGCGDADGYPDTYQDALGIMWRQLEKQGASLLGLWPAEGYDFDESRGLTPDGKHFFGLALDEHNESDLTGPRLEKWARQLEHEEAEYFAEKLVAIAS